MSIACRLLMMILTLWSLAFAQADWILNINLQNGTTSIPLTIGGAPTATDGFDAAFDLLSPPPPPSTTDYFAYLEIIDPLFTMVTSDIRGWVSPYSASIEWTIRIMNSGGAQTTITWNQAQVPANGNFFTVGGTTVNMRTASSTTFSGDGAVYIRYSQAASQTLTLNAGWNMISSYIDPPDSTLPTLLGPLGSYLTIAKDNGGQVYWPAYGINTIGKWKPLQGYKCYLTEANELTFTGDQLAPESTPIPLTLGWNTVAYLRTSALSSPLALASIVTQLIIAKNMAGGVYWPQYNINTIGNMLPGQGYQIYVTAAVNLSYPANGLSKEALSPVTTLPGCIHFAANKQLTGSNAILLWQDLNFSDGDEIAVFTDDGKLAGSGVIQNGRVFLTVWGDDSLTEFKDGAKENEALSLRHWSRENDRERMLVPSSILNALSGQILNDGIRFVQDCVLVLEGVLGTDNNLPVEYNLAQNYPNPFNPTTEISFSVPKADWVKLGIYNIKGELVRILIDKTVAIGAHSLRWNGMDDSGRSMPGGIYFLRMSCSSFEKVVKMSFIR